MADATTRSRRRAAHVLAEHREALKALARHQGWMGREEAVSDLTSEVAKALLYLDESRRACTSPIIAIRT